MIVARVSERITHGSESRATDGPAPKSKSGKARCLGESSLPLLHKWPE